MRLHTFALASALALSSIAVAGCSGESGDDSQSQDVGDAKNSKVERQAIGNCSPTNASLFPRLNRVWRSSRCLFLRLHTLSCAS